jgi:hypothetical protein
MQDLQTQEQRLDNAMLKVQVSLNELFLDQNDEVQDAFNKFVLAYKAALSARY